MRKSWKAWSGTLAISAISALLLTLPLAAQQTAKEAEQGAANPAEYQKRLKPEDKFEILGRFAGTWQGNLKAWLHGSPPREAAVKDTLEAKWILNDRFLDTHFTTELGPEVSRGRVTMGYNGATRQFYRIFLADWDPRGTLSTGAYIRSKNALVFQGMEHDPVSGDSFEKRDVFTFVDKDKIFYEQFYSFADGSEIKVIEGHYTRVTGK